MYEFAAVARPDLLISLPYRTAFTVVAKELSGGDGAVPFAAEAILDRLVDASNDHDLAQNPDRPGHTAEQLAEYRQRAITERILRGGDPYYEVEYLVDGTPVGGGSAWERIITPDAVEAMVEEILSLRSQVDGVAA